MKFTRLAYVLATSLILATVVTATPNPVREVLNGEADTVAEASHCSATLSAPFKTTGPRLRATGGVSCGTTQSYLDVRITIWGTGPGCGSPCRYADSGWDLASNVRSNNVAVNSGLCRGTYSVWATIEWRAPLHGGAKSSSTKVLSC